MMACDKCGTEKDVSIVSVAIASDKSKGEAKGELCPQCAEGLAAAVAAAGVPVELAERKAVSIGH